MANSTRLFISLSLEIPVRDNRHCDNHIFSMFIRAIPVELKFEGYLYTMHNILIAHQKTFHQLCCGF